MSFFILRIIVLIQNVSYSIKACMQLAIILKVYKKDSVTGKTVLQNNVKYVIYNEAGELQTLKSWSAENGSIFLPGYSAHF